MDNLPDDIYLDLIQQLKNQYPQHHLVECRQFVGKKDLIPWNMMNWEYKPREINSEIIEKILNNLSGKTILTVAPRHRLDV